MKFNIKWLENYFKLQLSAQAIGEQLTALGLEIESIVDNILEIAVPPNRADCLSITGIARELAAKNQINCKEKNAVPVVSNINIVHNNKKGSIEIEIPEITAKAACPKYIGRIVSNIKINTKTPEWIKECLHNAGINSILPVVDITNYVMLELGQPLHAFDLSKLSNKNNKNNKNNKIIIRYANASNKESLILLDDQKIKLRSTDLVITDGVNPIALAGIMGGKDSAVTETTTDILIECAYFEPIGIRKSAKYHRLQSDSSYRFERGIDCAMQEKVIERITELLLEIVGGEPGPIESIQNIEHMPKKIKLFLRKNRIKQILGVDIDSKKIEDILSRLGMKICANNNNDLDSDSGWEVEVPTFRTDLVHEIDLIEDVARLVGYDNIPAEMPLLKANFTPNSETIVSDQKLKQVLISRGYYEAITYSFIEPKLLELFTPDINYLSLVNPISENLSVMRTSLWPGLVKSVQYNQHRQAVRCCMFEIGLKFNLDLNSNAENLTQQKVIAGIWFGQRMHEQWAGSKEEADFFDIKQDLEALLSVSNKLQKKISYVACKHNALHPGQAAKIIYNNNQEIGIIGAIHPRIIDSLDLAGPIFVFELDIKSLQNGSITEFKKFSKFPAIRRDLAIIVDADVTTDDIRKVIVEHADNLLQDIIFFDLYQGKGVEVGKKSLAFGLILQHPSRTLKDDEVVAVMDKFTISLKEQCGALLRN